MWMKIVMTVFRSTPVMSGVHGTSETARSTPLIIAHLPIVSAAMFAVIGQVMMRPAVMKMMMVGVHLIDTQVTMIVHGTHGAEKTLDSHEAGVQTVGKHPTEFIVALIQTTVIGIHGIRLMTCHRTQISVDNGKEDIVDFVQMIVLTWRKVQLESHTVCQETCIHPDIFPACG